MTPLEVKVILILTAAPKVHFHKRTPITKLKSQFLALLMAGES